MDLSEILSKHVIQNRNMPKEAHGEAVHQILKIAVVLKVADKYSWPQDYTFAMLI